MVSKRVKHIGLMVYHHEYNNERFIAEVLRQCLGYHFSQALNCANVILIKGEYLVKTFKVSEQDKARAVLKVLHDHDIPAKLIPL